MDEIESFLPESDGTQAEVDVLQAEIMRTLAQPHRLRIVHQLAGGPIEVRRLAGALGISQPNASQHLAILRAAGVVQAERSGRDVRYRLSDPEVLEACALMRGVLVRRLGRLAGLTAVAMPTAAAPDSTHAPLPPSGRQAAARSAAPAGLPVPAR